MLSALCVQGGAEGGCFYHDLMAAPTECFYIHFCFTCQTCCQGRNKQGKMEALTLGQFSPRGKNTLGHCRIFRTAYVSSPVFSCKKALSLSLSLSLSLFLDWVSKLLSWNHH